MLSQCEFQLIQSKEGTILGRLFHPRSKFNVTNSKRKIISISHGGRCLTFFTTPEDLLHLYRTAQSSNLSANRIRTNQLAQQLKAQVAIAA